MTRKVRNADSIRRKMLALPKTAKAEIRKFLDKSADEHVALARQLAPRAEGELEESILKRQVEHELQVLVVAGDKDAFYANLVEHGTVKTPAQPFMFPSFRLVRKRGENRIKRALKKAVRDANARS